jgi:peptidoglycan hydrolase CwlO-like protein
MWTPTTEELHSRARDIIRHITTAEDETARWMDRAIEVNSNLRKLVKRLTTRIREQIDELNDAHTAHGNTTVELEKCRETITELREKLTKLESDHDAIWFYQGKFYGVRELIKLLKEDIDKREVILSHRAWDILRLEGDVASAENDLLEVRKVNNNFAQDNKALRTRIGELHLHIRNHDMGAYEHLRADIKAKELKIDELNERHEQDVAEMVRFGDALGIAGVMCGGLGIALMYIGYHVGRK